MSQKNVAVVEVVAIAVVGAVVVVDAFATADAVVPCEMLPEHVVVEWLMVLL